MGRIKIYKQRINESIKREIPDYIMESIDNMAKNIGSLDFDAYEVIYRFYQKIYYETVNNCSDDETHHFFFAYPHYIYSRKFRFACVHVNKNATTSIRAIIAHYDLGYPLLERGSMGMYLVKEINKDNCVFLMQKPVFKKDVVRFAVWRDPYERLKSSLNTGNYSIERVMSLIQTYTYDGGCKDQHLARQSDFYTVDDVDYIVKIEDLNRFLEEVIKVPKEGIVHNNKSPKKISLSFFHFNDEQKAFFDEYYAPDYKLLESNKVWYPEEK